MATKTLGTNATTSLTAMSFNGNMTQADVATLAALIKDDLNGAHPVIKDSFTRQGLLFIPNRGVLQMLPGDYVAVDSTTGWPILVSKRAAASGPYTHT